MKKAALSLALALYAAGFAVADEKGHYVEIKGTLLQIDGDTYVVEDKNGKARRFQYDSTTIKEGAVAPGAKVEIYVDKGNAKRIIVLP